MKIYTSYFAGKKIGTPIGIARNPPKWFKGASYKRLAPYSWMLSDSVSEEKYKEEFKKILSALTPSDVVSELSKFSNGGDITLLCYEKTGQFCHRHMVAEWLMNAGYDVLEVSECCSNREEKPDGDPNQLSMFT